MRIYKTFMHPTQFPIEYTCNKCGHTLYAERDNLEEFMTDSIHPFKTSYGYASKRDGEYIYWDLCEDCLEELYNSFVVPVKIERWF
jgi:hypothetical protein